MALAKLFERIFWHNNTTPAINEDNLNAMSKAIDDIDDRVISLGSDVMEAVPELRGMIADVEALSQNPPYIGSNGDWFIWDTTTASYVDSGIDASISVAIADVTMLEPTATPYVTNTGTDTDPIFHLFIPRGKGIASISKTGTSGLVDTYTITYSDGYTTTFTVTNGKSAYQAAVEGGYPDSEADFNEALANFKVWYSLTLSYSNSAYTYKEAANTSAKNAEAYAIGKRNGTDVTSEDVAYHNNSKYYAETIAKGNAEDAEAYGVGTRNGVPVTSGDPAYHNNSKYYSEQAGDSSWANITNKPFSSVGAGLSVSNDELQANVQTVEVSLSGTASASTSREQNLLVNGSGQVIKGTRYFSQDITLSTTNEVTATFTSIYFDEYAVVDVYTTNPNLSYKSINISNGSCTITFDKQDSASTITVRVYVK